MTHSSIEPFPLIFDDFLVHNLKRRANSSVIWNPFDTLERYEETKKSRLTTKTYKDTDFKYTFNSHGFRCDEFNNTLSPKILYAGCSHTEGIGLPQDKTWSAQLNKQLFPHTSIPYFNLGVGGSSIARIIRFIIILIEQIKFRPDLIIINFPNEHREEIFIKQEHDDFFAACWVPNNPNDEFNLNNFFLSRPYSFVIKNVTIALMLLKYFLNYHNIPFFTCYWNYAPVEVDTDMTTLTELGILLSKMELNMLNIPFRLKDCPRVYDYDIARDLLHFSPNVHLDFASRLNIKYGSDFLRILKNDYTWD